MSAQAVGNVLSRSYDDDKFVEEFRRDPAASLKPYDLSDDEIAAFTSGNEDAMLAAAGDRHEANYVIVFFDTQ